jgi:hypothetical protein
MDNLWSGCANNATGRVYWKMMAPGPKTRGYNRSPLLDSVQQSIHFDKGT